jgi:3-phosphoshikimate 1-carboxyvinyltransferase
MRAILFGSLAHGTTILRCPLISPDTDAMIGAMRHLGADIQWNGANLVIEGTSGHLKPPSDVIDAGGSGQVLRFVGALAALLPTYTVITGNLAVRNSRPVQPLLDGLTQLGGFAVSMRKNASAPIILRGPIRAGEAHFLGDDSQPVSALLMAATRLEGTSHFVVSNPGETPWVDLTLDWLHRLGAAASHTNHTHYTVKGPTQFVGFTYEVPGDFSSAAFPLAALAVNGSEAVLDNLDLHDIQGDKRIVSLLQQMGMNLDVDAKKKQIATLPTQQLRGIAIDANLCIDAVPILAVLGCFSSGTMEITNAQIARRKESDRLHAITSELRKMGATILEKEDGLTIFPSRLKGAVLSAHADHRIGMALTIAAMNAEGISHLEGAEWMAKSYPSFIEHLQTLGASIEAL